MPKRGAVPLLFALALAQPAARATPVEPLVSAHVRWVDRRQSPPLFLQPLRLRVAGSRQQNVRALARLLPLNPVPRAAEVFQRRFGIDVVNALLIEHRDGRAYVTLREQARMPVALRNEHGLPGGRSFTMAESFGGSLEADPNGVEQVKHNLRHEAAEELGIDAGEFKIRPLFTSVAISPDRSLGAAHGVVLETWRPVSIEAAALTEARSGEVAETGARALERVPFARAIRYLQTGQVIDGRTALLLLSAAYQLQLPLPPALAGPPGRAERSRLGRDFDPERGDVRPSEYSRFTLLPSQGPAERWQGRQLAIDSRRVQFASRDGTRMKIDPHEHKAALAPDQVSELPVVRTADGAIWVGLVPTIGVGVLSRELPTSAGKVSPVQPPPAPVQLRGIVRDVASYAPATGASGGNLGVRPRLGGAARSRGIRSPSAQGSSLREAHRQLRRLGLSATRRVTNLGQFNASTGENGFQMNLYAREYTLRPGVHPAQIHSAGLRLVPLHDALEQAALRPHEVDQLTQVQLFLLALRNRVGFRFE
jgi:hypothetical protein